MRPPGVRDPLMIDAGLLLTSLRLALSLGTLYLPLLLDCLEVLSSLASFLLGLPFPEMALLGPFSSPLEKDDFASSPLNSLFFDFFDSLSQVFSFLTDLISKVVVPVLLLLLKLIVVEVELSFLTSFTLWLLLLALAAFEARLLADDRFGKY